MGKDSVNSYEQKMWELSVAHYEKLKVMLTTFIYEEPRALVLKRMKEYEDQYPQLKQ